MAAAAKPIAFAKGTTVMAEYGAGTMNEVQVFHAPRYWWSVGGGWLELSSEDGDKLRHITYARANLLAKRWNLPAAQANVFVWGGLGRATGNDFDGSDLARNVGFQTDYETRRVYAAFRADLQESDHFSHRIDTLQLGWAPYAHDYDTLATWFVVQGRRYTGDLFDGTETALLVRFFKGGTWVEFGATRDGKLQAMAMFNF
ncbi:hypothetical protein IU514_14080 [Lysobacter niastensis]|uniref:Alginate export domain-containing protein n=2 Tax=Lysobacter niastensis TaxID=380629 RepID=A0ABS0B8I9_9GAMM|nr:hypothetical protein [Lysobacter niastensis]